MNVNICILVCLCAFVCTVSLWGSFVWADLYKGIFLHSRPARDDVAWWKTARHQKNAALIKGLDDIFEEILPRGCTGTAVGVLRRKANISVGQRFGINLMEYMILHRQTSLGYGSSKWENMHWSKNPTVPFINRLWKYPISHQKHPSH